MTALMLFTFAWVMGILIAQETTLPLTWLLMGCPAAAVLLAGWGDQQWARRGAAMLLALLVGAGRLVIAQPRIDAHHIAFYNDLGEATVEGVLDGEPEMRSNTTRVRMKAVHLTMDSGEKRNVTGHVLVTLPPYGLARYGDLLTVQGKLETPPVFESFSYQAYLSHQGIYSVLDAQHYTVHSSHNANMLKDIILQFKTHAHSIILHLYPEPQAALLSGILLGRDSGIPEPLEDAFNATGTGHIVAISGFNLSLVAAGIAVLTRRIFKRKTRTWAALTGVWLYVVLVGGSAAVLRAGVMSSLGIIATHEQRKVHGPTVLAGAVLVLTGLNPYTLWDVGFRLSFAATLGMVLFTLPFETRLQTLLERWFKPERAATLVRLTSENFLVTIAVQLVTVGITVSTFRRISLVSLLANTLILPVQLYIMLFGGFSLLVGLVFHPLAQLVAWIAWVFLTYTISVVQILARLPQASVTLGSINLPIVWIYYGLLACGTWLLRSPQEERKKVFAWLKARNPIVFVTAAAVAVLFLTARLSVPDGKLHITFMDVGAGEAIFIRTPHGKQILIDGGMVGARSLAQIGQQMPFWDRDLDMAIITSPDKERLTGMLAVLERYHANTVVSSGETTTSEVFAVWQERLSELSATATVIAAAAGDRWILDDDVYLDMLWPPAAEDGPLVLQLTYGNTSVLLPGDATTVVEEAMVETYGAQLRSSLLLVPRHGADTSATPAFLQAVHPQAVVVTGDEPVSPYVLARLSGTPLYRTSKNGSVMCRMNGETLKIRTTE
ncbi:MAG: ComEC/Rec2 family competence protein [Anaerolineae bacterium]|nr:ComEC/Rec2 family competence protein [Anaerolineae bacterium]